MIIYQYKNITHQYENTNVLVSNNNMNQNKNVHNVYFLNKLK